MKRNRSIRVMLTKSEKDSFVSLAKARHTDISELVRQLLHREISQKAQAA